MSLTIDQIRRAPKVLLHDHLDGGLRPQTMVDLARQTGYGKLPADDATGLAEWMAAAAQRAKCITCFQRRGSMITGLRNERR